MRYGGNDGEHMNTKHFSLSRGVVNEHFPITKGILWSLVLAVTLAGMPTRAAEDAKPAEEKPKSVVAVFRLDGPISEVPPDDTFQMFGPVGTSLKELVARVAKAAQDPAVKAVVILPEMGLLGSGQVEELRAAMALVREHGKEVYVHADELMMGEYVLGCGATRISVVPTGLVLVPGLHASS